MRRPQNVLYAPKKPALPEKLIICKEAKTLS